MTMTSRHFLPWRHCTISTLNPAFPCLSHSRLARALSWFLPIVYPATEFRGHHYCSSSISNSQEVGVSETKWLELPPVPKQGRGWASAWELNKASRNLEHKGSDLPDGAQLIISGAKQVTALQWVTKCCPSLPNSLLHKLFRVRQVRQRTPVPENQSGEQPSDTPAIEQRVTRMRRVSVKAVLEEGAVLYMPKSVYQSQENARSGDKSKKTEHQPTAAEVALLQGLVLYKDAEILVINKPSGLPVQGGSQIKRSLDSLMGTALCFEYRDGPRLVHRLDKETSGLMILARTQECAMLMHTLFREKTATATEIENDNTSIRRVYWALVIGTPKKSQGRISAPLMKVVLDDGKADKIMVCHDFSSENAQVAITDYKIVGPSFHGCTWLELHPLTGRKHQLRVHCAEVLGTPVFGDMKYGWRTQKEWLKNMSAQISQASAFRRAADNVDERNTVALKSKKPVKGSILTNVPLLHLHCREMVLPNVLQMLEKDRSRLGCVDPNFDRLQFLAPLPSHMAASRKAWPQDI